MLTIKLVAALLLLAGTGIIFRALVEMDRPTFRPRPLPRRAGPFVPHDEEAASPLRKAA